MRFRKLRIAWSVMFGTACVLLIVLWVRSHQYPDVKYVNLPNGRKLNITSAVGKFFISSVTITKTGIAGILATKENADWQVIIPQWGVVVMVTSIAAAPWLPRTYDPRKPLVATTLVAIALGFIVWVILKVSH
jgi:hypothetical protein